MATKELDSNVWLHLIPLQYPLHYWFYRIFYLSLYRKWGTTNQNCRFIFFTISARLQISLVYIVRKRGWARFWLLILWQIYVVDNARIVSIVVMKFISVVKFANSIYGLIYIIINFSFDPFSTTSRVTVIINIGFAWE